MNSFRAWAENRFSDVDLGGNSSLERMMNAQMKPWNELKNGINQIKAEAQKMIKSASSLTGRLPDRQHVAGLDPSHNEGKIAACNEILDIINKILE